MKFSVHYSRHLQCEQIGFTLIETLVAIAVMAILASLAAPSFTTQFQRYRVDATRDAMIGSMNLAKSEAIRGGQAITIQKRSPGGACSTAGDWSCGWQVVNSAGLIIEEFTVPSQTAVLKSAAQDSFTINRYGFVDGGHNILIYPSSLSAAVASPLHSLLCFSVGSRVQTIRNAIPPCT